jgi:hypothetical protein
MLYMKEDDMDEMLRKAAENYEVDAAKAADWNAVYSAVHENEATAPVEKKKKRRFVVFWWLLLIPLGWIANTEYNKFHTRTLTKNDSANSVRQKNSSADIKQTSPQKNLIDKNSPANNTTVAIDNTTNNTGVHKNETLKSLNLKRSGENNFKTEPSLLNQQSTNQSQTAVINQPINNSTVTNPAIKKSNVQDQAASSDLSISNNNNPQTANDIQGNTQSINNSSQQNSSPVVLPDDAKNKKNTTAKSTSIKLKSNSHYVYGGLIAGSDLSFIKYQKAQPLGYNVGLLVGYKFNKISIESGISLDKKNYYTTGEYFDKSKIPFFNNAELLSANGYCRMYEIPLNIKYDISSIKKHTWFATAGLSSYLMNKEFYHYAYKQNGVNGYGSYPYFHTTKNWFSVVNLSAGYQLQMNTKTNLRIEPYYKTTLSGVGTGSLTITSAGLNIGITKRIP